MDVSSADIILAPIEPDSSKLNNLVILVTLIKFDQLGPDALFHTGFSLMALHFRHC